jgi:hypothetical protein
MIYITPTLRREDNIKTYLEGIVWKGVDWIHLAEDKKQCLTAVDSEEPVGSVMHRECPDVARN